MAGTITTTTDASAFDYPSQSFVDIKVKNGASTSMFMVTLLGTTLNVYRSPNAGASAWAAQSGMSLARTGIVELGGFFIDTYGYGHLTYRVNESSKDRIFYRRINLESDPNVWGTELLVCEAANGGVAGAVYTGSDLVAARYGNQMLVAIAVGFVQGTTQGIEMHAMRTVTGSAFPSVTGPVTSLVYAGTRRWTWTGTGRQTPVVELQHYGDAHTYSSPHLWVAMGRAQQRMVKMTWTGGKWTGPASVTTLNFNVVAQDAVAARWDGARFVVATVLTASLDAVTVYERDSANTKTITRATPVHPTGNIRAKAISYDHITRDLRVWAVGTSTGLIYFVDYIRATGAWTAWAQFNATAPQSIQSWGVRRGTYPNAKYDVYWEPASASPYTLTHVQQALSYAPNLPAWEYPSPNTGSAANVGEPLALNWLFSDPDPGDTMSAHAISRQIGAGTIQYYRASDGTWQATEQKNTATVSYVELPAGWGADSDAAHAYRVKVWDSTDTPSGYGAALIVVPSVPSNPALTQPADGAVWQSEAITAVWTVTTQYAWWLRLYKVFDDFQRTVSGGLGNGNQGQGYTLTTPSSDYSVSAGVATISLPAVNSTRRARTTAQWDSSEVYIEFQVPVNAATQPIRVDLILGLSDASNYELAEAVIYPDGHVNLSIVHVGGGAFNYLATQLNVFGVAGHSTSRWYGMRFRWRSPNYEAKLWDTATAEPDVWDCIEGLAGSAQAPLAGGIGFQAYLSTGNTNTLPVAVRFRQFTRGQTDRVYDSGYQSSQDTREAVIPYSLPDLSSWRLELQTRNAEGLQSDIDAAPFTVDYLETPAAALTVTAQPQLGLMRVVIDNPAPVGAQPAFASQDLYRRRATTYNTHPNSDVETDLAGWFGANSSIARSTVRAHRGVASIQVTPSGTGGVAGAESVGSASVSVVEGDQVTADGWVWLTTSSKPAAMQITWLDSVGAFLSSTSALGSTISGHWQYVTVTGSAPAGAATAAVRGGVGSTPTAADICFVDEVRIRRANNDEGTRYATGLGEDATFDDTRAVSGVDYEYRVRTFGANGTRVDGAWT